MTRDRPRIPTVLRRSRRMIIIVVVVRHGRRRSRGRGIREEAFEVVSWDDLHERAGFDVADFYEGRLEGEDIGVV